MAQFLTDFPEIAFKGATWVDLLRYRALHQPLQRAFSFLGNGETASSSLSYGEFDRLARSIASQLQSLGLAGERALLLYPPGLEYLAAFFGCLYAGVIAVPAYPPRNQRNAPRIQAIAKDAQAAIALTTSAVLPKIQGLLTEKGNFRDLKWLASDRVSVDDESDWQMPAIDPNSLAFLQYTSGSTGTPKGVMLIHGNLMHNAAMTYRMMEHSPDCTFVSWLPVYHDMGLIGGVLQPLYGGFPCVMMPPASFLQSPYSWLKAISDYGGTTSGGPNFAYELCINKITPEQRASLNLSTWNVAFNGAEPIRHETLERFAATFAECGFRPEAFYPCYGMAETTLMVSGGVKGDLAIAKTVEVSALERNQIVEKSDENTYIRTFVGCGKTIPEQQIVIANPETLTRCLPNEIGEIWVSGPSVGQGYWNRQEDTEQTFNAYLSDTKEGPFLRTGDLGFLQNGELFVTGRAKDLIIIRGRNLYPQDIEQVAERSHPSLRISGSAAFAVEVENEERLVIVQELEFRQKPNIDEVISAIRQAVTEAFEIQVYGVVLIKAGSIPKTSSGKIQRRATREKFLAGDLDVVGSNVLESADEVENEIGLSREMVLAISPEQRHSLIAAYLQQKIALILGIAASKINLEQPPISLGIDSLKLFEFKNQIETNLNVAISIEALFESASIGNLASQIVEKLGKKEEIREILRHCANRSSLPLSFAQQRLWFLDRLQPENPFYNIAIAAELKGQLNIPALKQSFNEIVRRHEALRTNFVNVFGTPTQIIATTLDLPLPIVDLRHLPENERKLEAEKLAVQEAKTPFNLTEDTLLRVTLLQLGETEHWMVLNIHHIVADGWSFGVLFRELSALYEAFSQGKDSPLAELPIQYADYAIWQRQWLSEEVIQTQLNYWKKQLENLPVLELPKTHSRSPVQTLQQSRLPIALDRSLVEKLKELSQQQGVTLFMTLLASFQTLLYGYTGQTDIVVGTDIANRNPIETEELIGFFVNELVLRTNLSGNPTFEQLLQRVRQTTLAAYSNSDIPFDKLVEELNPERRSNNNPLFDVKFSLQKAPLFPLKLTDTNAEVWEIDPQTAKYDLLFNLVETDGGLVGYWEYGANLFSIKEIERLAEQYQTLLGSIVNKPKALISELEILSDRDRQQILVEFNQTKTSYPHDKCIHQLFEAQVERTPNNIAVVFNQEKLTYSELNARANQLAHYLQKLGVQPEQLVGVCVERSLEMAIAVLGILKAGGAYVPIDPAYPQERKNFILEDTQMPILLTQQSLIKEDGYKAKIICLDTDWEIIAQQSTENPISQTVPENLAYSIYTSGSTGKPKGTLIPHRGLVNYLSWCTQAYAVEQGKGTLVHSPLGFDLTITSLFSPLLVGCSVELLPESQSIENLSNALREKDNLSLVKITPAHLELLGQQLSNGNAAERTKAFIIGGENLLVQHIDFWQKNAPDTMLVNEYGPTETVVGCCVYKVPLGEHDSGSIPIGKPIANTQLYVLNQHLQPVPIGVVGELHIGGVGVSRGYLNRPDLTAEKFIPNPFSDEPGTRLYKTGDLARYQPDGTLECLGRIDNQVKIRGFRIELGEVEAVLSEHPDVQEAVVLALENVAGGRLVAYLVGRENVFVDGSRSSLINELRCFIKQKLPEYMVPSTFIFLDVLPLTINGKIDRKALLTLAENQRELADATILPSTELEKAIANVWQQVLNLEKVGIHDNFFDLGGHSLLVAQVQSKLEEVLQREIPIVQLMEYSTIHSLAKSLSEVPKLEEEAQLLRDRVQKQRSAGERQRQKMKASRSI